MKNRPRELGRLTARLRSLERPSKVTIQQQVGSSHEFTNESSRHQGLDLPAPVQPAEASSFEYSDLSALDEDSRYQGLDLPAAVQLAEASSSEHSDLSALDEDFLSPSTWINKQKQTEEEVWSRSYVQYLQRFRGLDTGPSLTTLMVDETDGFANRFPLKDLASIRCLEGQVQELLSAAPTLAFYDLTPRSDENPTSGIDFDLSMKELILRFENRPKAATKKLARRSPVPQVRRLQLYDSAYQKLFEVRNVLIHACRMIEMLQSRGIASTGVSVFVEAREQVVQLIPLSLLMTVGLVKRLNQSLIAITWAVEEDIIPSYSTSPDSPSDLLVVSPISLFAQETVDRVEIAPLNLPMLAGFWWQIVSCIDTAVISYCGAHLVEAPEHYSALSRHVAPEKPIRVGSLCFSQVSLACMSSFLQKKRIWVLQEFQPGRKPLEGAFLSTTVTELADIWGPVCQWTRDSQSTHSKSRRCYFTIGSGVIAGCSEEPLPSPVALPDEALCHYLPSRKVQAPSEGAEIDIERYQRLLIGARHAHSKVSLVEKGDCNVTQRESLLGGITCRPYGTSKDTKYKDAQTFGIAAGFQGSAVSTTSTYKLRHGQTRKQRMLARWRDEPDKRNGKILSLWCGSEFSLCTRNIRRRQLIHVLASDTLLRYMEYGQFEMKGDMCMKTFKRILASGDSLQFAKVYKEHRSWRKDMGKAISWLFTAIEDTGLNETRDLSAYLHCEGFSDPHHEVVISRKHYTWVPLLNDSVYTATFAIASGSCLELSGSNRSNVLKCRGELSDGPQHSVLQTVLFPVSASGYELSSRWSRRVNKGTQLPIQGMKIESLKVVKRLRGGSLLLRLSHNYLKAAANLILPPEYEFQEQMDTPRDEGEFAVTAFVRSKVKINLVPLGPKPRKHPGSSTTTDVARSLRERHSFEAEPEDPNAPISVEANRRPGDAEVSQKRRGVTDPDAETSSDEASSDEASSEEASSDEDSSNEDFCHDKPRKGAREESESPAMSENAQINARNSFPGKKTAVPQPRGRAHDSPAPLRSFEHVSRSSVRSRSTSLVEGRTLDHQAHGGSLRTAMDDQRKGKQVVRERSRYR